MVFHQRHAGGRGLTLGAMIWAKNGTTSLQYTVPLHRPVNNFKT